MRTIKLLLLSFSAAAVLFTGCKRYDDSDLREKVENHEQRIVSLEDAVASLQTQMEAGAMIRSVTALEDGDGWRIEFTGGSTPYIDIFNGAAAAAPDPTDYMPVIEVRDNGDGTTTIWVDYGDGFENTGVEITGPQGDTGAAGPEGPQGIPGVNAVTPIFEVHPSEGGGNSVWYNVTVGYLDSGWVDTEWDITGAPGVDAVTPIFRVVKDEVSGESFVEYNVTLADEDPETDDDTDTDGYADDGWVRTGADLTGAPGLNGVSPIIKVDTEDGGETWYIYYNVTPEYPESGWEKTEEDISAIGPVRSIVNNNDGTVTITMNDEDGTEFDFERASTAVRLEIMSYEAVNIPNDGTGYVKFVVNPSTAHVSLDPDDWYLNALGTRAPGYVNSSTAFAIAGITPADSGEGEYKAAIQRTGEYTGGEHMVALVLNTTNEENPVLVSSSFFALVMEAAPPILPVISIIDQPDNIEITEWNIPASTNISVAADVTDGASLSYQWYSNDTASNEGGTAIDGATSATYPIPTDTAAGTYYYFVEVTGTGGALPVRSDAATVTVTADRDHQDPGVVINGITWATRNVGASGTFVAAPTDYGSLYNFDDAQGVCPTGWRLPTRTEFESFGEATRWVEGSPNGREFGPTNGEKIFMPAAGFDSWFGGHQQRDIAGSYWSSTTDNDGFLGAKRYFSMVFRSENVDTDNNDLDSTKNSVRCVKAE